MLEKIKGKGKRIIAGVLIGVSLFTATVEPYYQVQEVQAMTGASTALYTLFTMIMAACGVSCGSKSQNNALCDAFSSWFNDVKAGKEVVDGIVFGNAADEMSNLKGIAAGKHFALSSFPTIVKLMKYFISKVAPQYVSSKTKYKGTGKVDYGSTTYYFASNNIYDIASKNCDDLGIDGVLKERVCNIFKYSTIYGLWLDDTQTTCRFYALHSNTDIYPQGSYVLINNGSEIYRRKDVTADNFATSTTDNRGVYYISLTRSSITSSWSGKYYSHSTSFLDPNACVPISDSRLKIFAHSCPVYTSYDQLQDYVKKQTLYKLVEGLYGDTSQTFDYPSNYQATAGDESLADAITKGVSDALAASQDHSLTSDEISAIISANIVDYSAQLKDIDESLEEVNNTQVVTNSWLSKIYSAVVALSAKVDGSSALSLDDSDAFQLIEGGAGKNNDDDQKNEDPKIWGLGAFTAVKFLQPLIEIFAEPLSEVTKWLNSINNNILETSKNEVEQSVKAQEANANAIQNVIETIADFPAELFKNVEPVLGNIITSLDAIAQYALACATFANGFPAQIVEWISGGVSAAIKANPLDLTAPDVNVEFPPIEIPILTDILAVLQAIALSVSNFFSIDTDVLDETMQAQQDKVEDKLPFTPAIALFDSIKFSDDYDYPVLKMQSPDVIKQFTGSEYIVLFDGQNFAQYFKVVRGLLTAFLWISYAYVIIRKFKVQITLD